MGQLVLAAAGALIAPTGYAGLGWAIGSTIGGILFAPKQPTLVNRQQVMDDLRVAGTEYGQPIPRIAGSRRTAGQLWWNSDRRAIENITTQTSGGKGGGGQTTVTITITYDVDLLIGLTSNEIAGISRIWNNGELIWNATEGATVSDINNSSGTEAWSRMTVYTGSSTQLPDPTYEAAVTTANAIAYRGRSYVFFESFHLGQSGAIPNLTFEVVADGSVAYSNLNFAAVAGAPSTNFRYSAYGDGAYVVGSYNTSNNLAYTHDNGATWTTISPFSGEGVNTLVYGDVNGAPVFVATTSTKIWYSLDRGATWTLATTVSGFAGGRGCFGNTTFGPRFVLLQTTSSCLTSPDGKTWTERTLPATLTWRAVIFLPAYDKFIAIASTGSGNQAAVSTDGAATWATVATPTSPVASYTHFQIAYDGAATLLCAGNGTGEMVSYDGGVTFTHYTHASMNGGSNIIYAERLWVKGGNSDQVTTSDDDLATWDTWTADATGAVGDLAYGGNKVWQQSDGTPYTMTSALTLIETVTKSPPTVAQVQSRICLAAGLSASQFDVTGLSTITNLVNSFAWNSQASPRTDTESLMAAYFYDAVVSDKIYFKPRGSASVASIAYADLGASEGEDSVEPLALKQTNDLEIPSQISLSYANISNDYQTDAQYSDRVISATAGNTSNVTMTVGLTPSLAKAIADTMLLDQVASRFNTSIQLLGEFSRLEPTDVVSITDAYGSIFRMRLVKKTDSHPMLAFDAVLDDASVLSSQAITSVDYTSSTTIAAAQDTQMRLMDIPILQDTDNDAGFYAATKGDDSDYPGAAIFRSPDNTTYSMRVTNPSPAVFGLCTTTLGNWTGPRVFDELNTVTVNVDEGTLASSTRDTVLDDLSVNAMLIGSELIQFVTATLVSTGIYTLSRLLRGGRGTEWAMTGHTANERCVLLRTTGIRRLELQNNELGQQYYYKGVTLGRAISTANAITFTGAGVGLKPFAPYDARIIREANGDITFTWQRRSRLSVRMIGSLGISVPLGEDLEEYEIDIFAVGSPTFGTVVRTLTANDTTVTYTAAQQSTDFGSPTPSTFNLSIYQLSSIVGRGYAYEVTL